MRLILISDKNGQRNRSTFSVDISILVLGIAMLCLISAGLGCLFVKAITPTVLVSEERLTSVLSNSQAEVETIRAEAQAQLDAYNVYLANIQARLIRLDAMGQRLTNLAGIENEFDFSENVGLGGVEESLDEGDNNQTFSPPDFMQKLNELSDRISTREKQLSVLQSLIVKSTIRQENYISGYPVKNAYISSPYGVRIDPITGKARGHKGIDFSAPRGSKIMAVAAGVVTFSGVKNGYGNVVEISHVDGYKTIYAHNQSNLVKAGDLVQTDQPIALVGSSGRATGPHVHFEVVRNSQAISPISYITRVNKVANPTIQMAKAE